MCLKFCPSNPVVDTSDEESDEKCTKLTARDASIAMKMAELELSIIMKEEGRNWKRAVGTQTEE